MEIITLTISFSELKAATAILMVNQSNGQQPTELLQMVNRGTKAMKAYNAIL